METVVVGVDGSEPSRAALEHAAESHPEATVHVPETTTEDLGTSGGAEGESERRGRLILDEAAEVASDHGVEVVTEMLYRSAPNSIVSCADEVNADLVVFGSRGRSGVRRILLGSTAEEVVRRAPCPVTVVR